MNQFEGFEPVKEEIQTGDNREAAKEGVFDKTYVAAMERLEKDGKSELKNFLENLSPDLKHRLSHVLNNNGTDWRLFQTRKDEKEMIRHLDQWRAGKSEAKKVDEALIDYLET